MQKEEDVDIVILWVDGNDPEWLKEKNNYQNYNKKNTTDSSENRYRDWDNIIYLFRGIEKFAPWIRKVHFVTWGHLPSWMNKNCKRLNIVNHVDFIPKQYLPTFNSHTIELNIHRIEGLADRFIYFNDDTFLLNQVKYEDFFKNGLPCDELIFDIIQHSGIEHIVLNDITVVNRHFNKKNVILNNFSKVFNLKYGRKKIIKNLLLLPWNTIPGFEIPHMTTPYLKETFVKLWDLETDKLNLTCESKFRYINDLNQYVMRFWQLCSGQFYPFKIHSFGKCVSVINTETAKYVSEQITKQKYRIICANDCLNDNSDFDECKTIINQSFEKLLPEKSDFEI